jgi:hypothetical protein
MFIVATIYNIFTNSLTFGNVGYLMDKDKSITSVPYTLASSALMYQADMTCAQSAAAFKYSSSDVLQKNSLQVVVKVDKFIYMFIYIYTYIYMYVSIFIYLNCFITYRVTSHDASDL